MRGSLLEPTRVLMTADTVGGVWTYTMELARALAPHDVDILVATMGAPRTSEQTEECHSIRNLTVIESSFRLEWMDDPWADVRAAGQWLLELERSFQPHVIHLNGYCHGAMPWQAPVLMVAHSCVLSWWQAALGQPAPTRWDTYRSRVAQGLAAARMVVAPTRAMLDAVTRHYGPLANTRVIPNGRDASLFGRAVKEPFTKEPLIFAAGRLWDEAKNLATLDRAAEHLAWPVYVAGELEHARDRAARTSHVRHLGRLAPRAMAEWLAKASIYALPARYEPFGLSILEAALSECALVLGDIESLRESWADAAVFVPPDDVRALADGIRALMENPARREVMAANARLRALTYTPARMAADYLACYTALTAEAGPPATPEET